MEIIKTSSLGVCKTFGLSLALLIVCLLVGGCSSSLLPLAKGRHESPWDTFEQAKSTFDKIIPYTTSHEQLHDLAFSPYRNPNIEIISYPDLLQKFMPNSSYRKENLAKGLQDCIEVHDKCYGYELKIQKMESKRYGNVFLDLLNFKRQTHTTGWQFNALIVLTDGHVVYKLWSGKPNIDEYKYRKNPLGPLQEPETLFKSIAVETTFE